jgi:hypothetical protein
MRPYLNRIRETNDVVSPLTIEPLVGFEPTTACSLVEVSRAVPPLPGLSCLSDAAQSAPETPHSPSLTVSQPYPAVPSRRPRKRTAETPLQLLMSRYEVDDMTGCWNWTGTMTRQGYGVLSLRGQQIIATRLSYSLLVGTIPDKRLLCHSCDNRRCINPSHLYAGTVEQNNQDRETRGRTARGERVSRSGMTEAKVRAIRLAWDNGEDQQALADQYEVSSNTIGDIGRRASWRHVPELKVVP